MRKRHALQGAREKGKDPTRTQEHFGRLDCRRGVSLLGMRRRDLARNAVQERHRRSDARRYTTTENLMAELIPFEPKYAINTEAGVL